MEGRRWYPPYRLQEDRYMKLYLYFVENKGVSYNKFISNLEELLGINVKISTLRAKIQYMMENISQSCARNMTIILDYIVAKRDKDNEKIIELYPYIRDIKKPIIKPIEKGKHSSPIDTMQVSHKTDEEFEKQINTLNEKMDIVIQMNKPSKELAESGDLKQERLDQLIKDNLRYVDLEKYIKFLKADRSLSEVKVEEIDQIIEIIRFFCENLKAKITELSDMHNELDILNFHVDGEENLYKKYENRVAKFKVWKLKKLNLKHKYYSDILNSFEEFRKTLTLDEFYEVNDSVKRLIMKDELFIYEYYLQLLNLHKEYKRLCSINTVGDEKRDKLKEEFINQMILRNN